MKRRAFISLVGGTMVASKRGEGKMNRIALAGILLILAVPAAAGPDALGCFTRTYDRAHLAQHPDQVVTAVMLRIYRPPPGNADKYWFLAQFRLRGKEETLRTNGICNEKASGACAAWSSATAAAWTWSLVLVTPRCILIASAAPRARTPDGS